MRFTPKYTPRPERVRPDGCISIMGMAAAGKTTIGRELASLIDWPQLDCDNLMESAYGVRLQTVADSMDKESFLDLECLAIRRLRVNRVILSTGGSAVYRQAAVDHLKSLGPIIYIAVPLPIILERIARKPDRGLAVNPGQTIEDLYHERRLLYEAAADITVEGGDEPAAVYAERIAAVLASAPGAA